MPSSAPDTDASPSNNPDQTAHNGAFERLRERLESLEAELERKDDRIADLEHDRDRLAATVDELVKRNADLEARTDDLEDEAAVLEERTTDLATETTELEGLTEAACNKANANKERVAELQSRELEKGAHLETDNVDECAVTVADGRLERIAKDDGHAYYRLPESADPLERGGDVSLAFGDLLPIQQLARMDDDRRRAAANSMPTRLAAKLWRARTDPSVGDDPWERGCKDVAEYVKASDLRHWIRRREPGISESYAKKLVSRTIDAALDLSKNRLAVRRQTERKNGLEYTERRLLLPADASIPGAGSRDGATATRDEAGESDRPDPETTGVHG
ncbi:hypothetical protein Htur_5243 (plasmid) [Haloterrigena turkmenica DSM 5511]|uniref:Uncharacterized protein n=1 Tax=Haloterrigena turkmenica (strain ATCC 51198 / DSM 5511 / JCM 9101 / NCIMB 13204 / VKM B-1734 / 4k) TaxID=543526 RepID=D2S3C7_HALTV|nr:hypothetical protein [Haloterrigena turkmenica]ADB63874.1 hypothetical protein Htur_5243 [Haloterrigena turkmenica DSM 5511]